MFSDALRQAQTALHGQNNSIVLPSVLVAAASGLVFYRHVTTEQEDDPIRHFLVLILIQMLPLIFLEMKILACPDPMAMLSRFGAKVLLMHGSFLGLRFLAWLLLDIGLGGMWNLIGLLAVCVALHCGFNFNLSNIHAHQDIGCLLLLAVVAATCTELLDFHRQESVLESIVFSSYCYIEILSFAPAVWIVYETSKKKDDPVIHSSTISTAERQAAFFFGFLIPFYVKEDLVSAFIAGGSAPLESAGHVVHFLLLLDFACFLLAHTYNSPCAEMLWF